MECVRVKDLGIVDYAAAWEMQRHLFDRLTAAKTPGRGYPEEGSGKAGNAGKEERESEKAEHMLLLCEHPHVYTLGKSGHASNLLVSEDFLRKIGASFFRIDRGGDITYHGYGQLVGYPILDLERFGSGLKEYIWALEESVIRTVADYGVEAGRLPGATGVWLDPESERARKICAIGVRASRFVTMHGFALNVNTDLNYFSYIHPCGFVDRGVTSLERETGRKIDMEEVKRRYAAHFATILKCEIK